MLALAYLVKHPSVQRKNRVRTPVSTNAVGCNGNMIVFLFLRGKHKKMVSGSNPETAQIVRTGIWVDEND